MILLWTFLATLGFAVLFEARGWHLFAAGAVGALAWALYLALAELGIGIAGANFGAAAAVTLCAEGLGFWTKRPVLTYLAPGLIPLVPGKALFSTMDAVVQKQPTEAARAGWETIVVAAALVVGVAAVSWMVRRRRPH